MTTNESEISKKHDIINIYLLAAPEDEMQCMAVKKYLTPVVRNSKRKIEIESDFEIPPGEDIKRYKERLYEAEIVIAFISSDFINDDVIYKRTQKVIELYNRNETVMLPILVRNCMWKSTPFVNLQLLPKNFQPLNNRHFWNSEDDALTAVVTDIYEAIEHFNYQNQIEFDQADDEVANALADVHINKAPSENEEVDSLNIPEKPIVEETKEKVETKKAGPEPIKSKPKNINNVAMEVDWRKKYYKDVLWKRALAYYLDNIITAIPTMFFALILWATVSVSLHPDDPEDVSDTEVALIIVFSLLFYFIICAIFESSKYRGTFGKLIMKLEITDRDGHRISFVKAFWRNIFRMLTAYSYILIIPLIIQIFTFMKTRKLFHDQISYTVVGEKTKR